MEKKVENKKGKKVVEEEVKNKENKTAKKTTAKKTEPAKVEKEVKDVKADKKEYWFKGDDNAEWVDEY